jgi:hypothetical protein
MKLTLCDKNFNGNIPTYDFPNLKESEYANDAQLLVYHWLETKKFNESVFVLFEVVHGFDGEELRNETPTLLVSHSWDNITDFSDSILNRNIDCDFTFCIFEFKTYKEAFQYCIDLKEGF